MAKNGNFEHQKNNNYNILKYIKYVRKMWAHNDILKQTEEVTGYF